MRLSILNCILISLCWCPLASAHPTLSDSIRHTNTLTIGTQYIDTTIELTFLGTHAQLKRRELDKNQDGHLESSELRAYARILLPKALKHVHLEQGQDTLELVNLYDPEIILGSTRGISTAPVTIRFSFFTHTPEPLNPHSSFTLRDTLYAGIPGNYRLSVTGNDGLHTQLISQSMMSHKPNTQEQPPVLEAKIISHSIPTKRISTTTETSHE